MGVYIPNMEKPKNCGECELRALDEWDDEYCVILRDDILVPYERMLDCPLIEIDQEDEEAVLFLVRARKAMREGKSLKEFLDGERRTDDI